MQSRYRGLEEGFGTLLSVGGGDGASSGSSDTADTMLLTPDEIGCSQIAARVSKQPVTQDAWLWDHQPLDDAQSNQICAVSVALDSIKDSLLEDPTSGAWTWHLVHTEQRLPPVCHGKSGLYSEDYEFLVFYVATDRPGVRSRLKTDTIARHNAITVAELPELALYPAFELMATRKCMATPNKRVGIYGHISHCITRLPVHKHKIRSEHHLEGWTLLLDYMPYDSETVRLANLINAKFSTTGHVMRHVIFNVFNPYNLGDKWDKKQPFGLDKYVVFPFDCEFVCHYVISGTLTIWMPGVESSREVCEGELIVLPADVYCQFLVNPGPTNQFTLPFTGSTLTFCV